MGTSSEKIAVLYAHFSKSKIAQKNYEYFIKNGIDTDSDIYLGTCTDEIEKCRYSKNLTLLSDNNSSSRIEAFNHLVGNLSSLDAYDRFIFVSSEMRGPFFDSQCGKTWTEKFCRPLTGDTHLSGTSVRLLPQTHPLTMMFRNNIDMGKPLPYVPLNPLLRGRACSSVLRRKFSNQMILGFQTLKSLIMTSKPHLLFLTWAGTFHAS